MLREHKSQAESQKKQRARLQPFQKAHDLLSEGSQLDGQAFFGQGRIWVRQVWEDGG